MCSTWLRDHCFYTLNVEQKILLPKILIIKILIIVLLAFQIYFCDLEIYSMIMTLHLKDMAHTDLNIWPLNIWHPCQVDHAEYGFRYEYRVLPKR